MVQIQELQDKVNTLNDVSQCYALADWLNNLLSQKAHGGQRSQMLHEHQVLLQAGERENEFVKSQTHSELQSRIV